MNPKVKSTASPEAKSSHCSVPQFPPSVSWRGNSCPVCCPELWGKVKRCGGPTDTSKEHQRAVCSSMKEVRMRPLSVSCPRGPVQVCLNSRRLWPYPTPRSFLGAIVDCPKRCGVGWDSSGYD